MNSGQPLTREQLVIAALDASFANRAKWLRLHLAEPTNREHVRRLCLTDAAISSLLALDGEP